jgi:hypothetical protein
MKVIADPWRAGLGRRVTPEIAAPFSFVKVAVSTIGPFIVTEAVLAAPEYDPGPEPVHELKEYPEAGEARSFTVWP